MKCLNRKVLGGLGLTALAVWALAPGVVGAALPLLFLAACPLSMVGMMWAMGRAPRPQSGNATHDCRREGLEAASDARPAAGPSA